MADQAGTRRSGLIALGIVLLVVGLVAAVGLWIAAGNRLDDSVTGLARAPVGCDTTLDFSETGEFILFVETKGEIDGVRGDCDVGGAYSIEGDEPPVVRLSMVDPDGAEVELSTGSGVDYDAAGFAGRSERVASITTTGDHVLRVESEPGADLFAVAVGKDPGDGVGLLRVGAIAAALAGLTAGIICIVLGTRRRQPAAAGTGWPEATAGWPQSPAGATQPSWGTTSPPSGPPQGWPSHPPTARPPDGPPAAQPPTVQPPPTVQTPPDRASWAADPAQTGQTPVTPPSDRRSWGADPAHTGQPPGLPGQPTIPGSPGAAGGASGDGERSPWAPPSDD